MARGDVEEAEFIRARRVIGLGALHGVAGIDEIDELHALHDAPVFHIEAGDDTNLEAHAKALAARMAAMACAGSSRPS